MKNTVPFIISLFLFITIYVNAQPFNRLEQIIIEQQDYRDKDIIKIIKNYPELKDEKYSREILLALANITDTNYNNVKLIMDIYSVQETIQSGEDGQNIQSLAAWALGQIPCTASLDFLRMMEEKEANEYSYKRIKNYADILNAFGKIGNEKDLGKICRLEFNNDSINSAIALSIARFGMRKIKSAEAIDKLNKLAFRIEDENQKQWIAYAFGRIGDKELLKDSHKALDILSASSNPYCRMWAFSAMGKTNDQSNIEYIMKRYSIEPDWRCRVNMLNSIGNLATDEASIKNEYYDIILNSVFNDSSANVSITACQVLAKICSAFGKESDNSQKLKNQFEYYLTPGKTVNYHVRNEMITTLAKVFKDYYRPNLFSLFTQTEDYDTKSLIISAFQYMNDPMVYREMRDTISNEVQRYNLKNPNKDGTMIGSPDLAKLYRAFVEALSVLDDKMDEENKNNTRLIFTEFASSKEPAIMDICLSSLTDSLYEKYWEETGIIMGFDIEGFDQVKDKDAILLYIDAWGKMKTKSAEKPLEMLVKSKDNEIAKAAADALKQITGREYITDNKLTKKIYDWDFINKLNTKRSAVINTENGTIKLELFPDIATFTVENFVKLTESGYYNNTIFHRVVPNFIIQGGDPKGTGYGGPGYSIRTEVADNTFDAYYVGMASSGKDTEGSQFFITHCPTPHLDGKYTIFGKVTEGFDAVDKIQIGDKIINITIQ
jgi:cyclophilin family peptidyl-prolyl cis-trans isomerase